MQILQTNITNIGGESNGGEKFVVCVLFYFLLWKIRSNVYLLDLPFINIMSSEKQCYQKYSHTLCTIAFANKYAGALSFTMFLMSVVHMIV